MDRRGFIAGAIASALAPTGGQGAPHSLRRLAQRKGLDLGTSVGETPSVTTLRLIEAHCTLITPEWQLKPRFLKPSAAAPYKFRPADEIVRLAEVNGQRLHGHSLFWRRQSIGWAESGDFATVSRHYAGFISDVVRRYSACASWDVFNEIVDHPGATTPASPVSRFGMDFIDFCFRAAHEAAPGAKLALNDHSLECAGEWCGRKQQNALRLLEKLLKRGTPVHALGIQGHLSSTWIPWARPAANFVRAVGELGLEVYLSELDVDDAALARNPVQRDLQVAGYYRDFLGPLLEQKALRRIVFWGLSDADHWMVREAAAGSRRWRERPRPALFDEHGEPKAAFEAVRLALQQAPER